jgi:xanthine dehydrogenase accessory factor
MDRELLQTMNQEVEAGSPGVLCTVVSVTGSTPQEVGATMWVREDGSIAGTVGGGVLEYQTIRAAQKLLVSGGDNTLMESDLNAGESGMICGGLMKVFLQVVGREERLLIFGGGHVGKEVARMGSLLGLRVIVWDEREEFANSEKLPFCEPVACPLEELFDRIPRPNSSTAIVIGTRGHALDADVVRLLDGTTAAYMGMLGSKKKIRAIRDKLVGEGVSEAHMDRIFQPIGVPIKAQTPAEIAVSILAEIIAVRRGAEVPQLRVPYGDVAVTA